SRMPGLAVMMAMTWIMGSTSSVGSWYLEGRDYHLTAGRPSPDRVEGRHVRSARVRSHPGRGRSPSPACPSALHSISHAAASGACTRRPAVVARQYVGPRGLALIGTGRAVLVSPTSRGIMGHDITHKAQDRRSMATPLTSSLARDVTNLLEHLGVTTQSHKDGTLIVRSPITGAKIGRVQEHDAAGARHAIDGAHEAFLIWRIVPAPRRGELIRLLGNELRAHKETLGRLVSIEVGKITSE